MDMLARLTEDLDERALLWLSGYTAGLAAQSQASAAPASAVPTVQPENAPSLTLLYGTQTGNAKRAAEKFAGEVEAAQLKVKPVSAADYKPRDLKKEQYLVVVVSTHGDGDPPDDALDLIAYLKGKRAPQLPQLKYGVLALGDSSYPDFCVTGRFIDQRLDELGAERMAELGECDLDIETVAEPWWEHVFEQVREALTAQTPAPKGASVTPLHAAAGAPQFHRSAPFAAEVLANQRITAHNTDKDIRHIELSLDGSDLHYQPGDALGIWHTNPSPLVESVLDALKLDGDDTIEHQGETLPLRQWLTEKRELTKLARPFIAAHTERHGDDELSALLKAESRAEFASLLNTHQLVDLLRRWPVDWDATALIGTLRPLTPRLYSIASSRSVVDDEVHLTVARVAYEAFDTLHLGAASGYLSDLADDEVHVPVYIEENPRFRLPTDENRDIIMIGPGTGVAPFRAFVQERAASEAAGRNWLFFGAQHFQSQFLYQLEWQRALKDGSLNRLDLAFSRDQAEKFYVQHRLRQRGADLYAWLEDGAQVYVCGAIQMEKDVREALTAIITEHGGKSEDQAEEYLATMQREHRYSRDTY